MAAARVHLYTSSASKNILSSVCGTKDIQHNGSVGYMERIMGNPDERSPTAMYFRSVNKLLAACCTHSLLSCSKHTISSAMFTVNYNGKFANRSLNLKWSNYQTKVPRRVYIDREHEEEEITGEQCFRGSDRLQMCQYIDSVHTDPLISCGVDSKRNKLHACVAAV